MQLLAEQQAQCAAEQQLQQHCSKLEERETASLQQMNILTVQLAEARDGLTGQQLQLLAAVDLQGRTHARLMQLTAEHEQVRLRRGTRCAPTSPNLTSLRTRSRAAAPQLTADHARVSQSLRALAAASQAADNEATARDTASACAVQRLQVPAAAACSVCVLLPLPAL